MRLIKHRIVTRGNRYFAQQTLFGFVYMEAVYAYRTIEEARATLDWWEQMWQEKYGVETVVKE